MPVTTLIDIDFFYGHERPIQVEERIVIPLGNRVGWRVRPELENPAQLSLTLLEIYFPYKSPFPWRSKKIDFPYDIPRRSFFTQELQAGPAETEGDFKYEIKVAGARNRVPFEYDEDPYLIIRRF